MIKYFQKSKSFLYQIINFSGLSTNSMLIVTGSRINSDLLALKETYHSCGKFSLGMAAELLASADVDGDYLFK